MSGLVGLWYRDGRPIEQTLLARLSATLAHRGPDGEGQWIRGAMGLACQNLWVTPESYHETQPLVDARGLALAFDGRLDNRGDLLPRLREHLPIAPDASDATVVLAAYQVAGEAFPTWLVGDFALALFDASRQRLVLVRDAIGVRPLYYCQLPHAFLCASEVKALLAHPDVHTQPNHDVIGDFLLDRWADSQHTCFQSVCSVPPAHQVVVTPQTVTVQRYWDFPANHRLRFKSFPEYAEAFRQLFEQAVQRRLRSASPVAVSVSGGLDSSAILCLAQSWVAGGRLPASSLIGLSYLTRRGSPSDEDRFVAEIERASGVTIHRVKAERQLFLDHARSVLWHVEIPFLDEQWSSTHALMVTAREQGARVLLTGHWGDQVLFPQAYLVDLVRRCAWRTVARHLAEFPRWMTDTSPRWFRKRFFTDLIRYQVPAVLYPFARFVRQGLRPSQHPWYASSLRRRVLRRQWQRRPLGLHQRTCHARAVYEEARSPMHVLCMEWDAKAAAMHGLDVAFPYLDRDLIAFLMAIPGEQQTHQGIPKVLLREGLRGVLPERIAQRRWKGDFTDVANATIRAEYPRLLQTLAAHQRVVAGGYVDGTVLKEQLERLRAGLTADNCTAAWALSDLLGLELWLDVFYGGGAHEAQRNESAQAAVPLATTGAVW